MIERRTVIRSLGALPFLALQPKELRHGEDPKLGFLGFGAQSERRRVAAVLDKVTGFGERYGFQTVALDSTRIDQDGLRNLSGVIVYGARVGELEDSPSKPSTATVDPGFSSVRLGPKAVRALVRMVKRGAGLLAIHGAAGISPSQGPRARNQIRRSAWVSLLGGESLGALEPQEGRVRMSDRSVPGLTQLESSFAAHERWLAFKNFDPQMHVVMVQDTAGLHGNLYERPSFPLTWLRYHGKGRVFYTGLGYQLAGWQTDVLRRTIVGGALWVLRDTEADVSSNLMRVTPEAIQAEYPG